MAVITRPSYGILGKQYNKLASDRCKQSANKSVNKPVNKPTPSSQFAPAAIPYDPKSKRRVAMALVDLCTAYIESLWPKRQCRLPLRQFVFEILRRSRVQYPVFQVALCYMARLQPVIRKFTNNNQPIPAKLACGRRVLVAALQVASKFLQDHCYSVDVWARISGLPKGDLVANELALMETLEWRLFISSEAYIRSCNRLRVTVDAAFAERAIAQREPALLTPSSSPSISTVLREPEAAPEVEIWNYNSDLE